jgi:hypothetical protein
VPFEQAPCGIHPPAQKIKKLPTFLNPAFEEGWTKKVGISN